MSMLSNYQFRGVTNAPNCGKASATPLSRQLNFVVDERT